MKERRKFSQEYKTQAVEEYLILNRKENISKNAYSKKKNLTASAFCKWVEEYIINHGTNINANFIKLTNSTLNISKAQITVNYYGATIDCDTSNLMLILESIKKIG